MAWRSQEQARQMKKRFAESEDGTRRGPSVGGRRLRVPKKYLNAEGKVDVSKMTGEEAWKYFQAQGVQLPIMRKLR